MMLKTIVAVILPLAMLVTGDGGVGGSDAEAIKQTATDYAQSWYTADTERMERALHPDLAKRVLMPDPRSGRGKIEQMSALTLVQAVRQGHGTKLPTEQRKAEVTILDVYGDAASVRLDMHDWIDYMHMSKVDGRWVIVNVLWEMTPEAKDRRRGQDRS